MHFDWRIGFSLRLPIFNSLHKNRWDGAAEAIDGHVELLIEGDNGLPEFRTLDEY